MHLIRRPRAAAAGDRRRPSPRRRTSRDTPRAARTACPRASATRAAARTRRPRRARASAGETRRVPCARRAPSPARTSRRTRRRLRRAPKATRTTQPAAEHRGRGLKAWGGRRDATGKVLKDRRSPRRRGRTGTSRADERHDPEREPYHTAARERSVLVRRRLDERSDDARDRGELRGVGDGARERPTRAEPPRPRRARRVARVARVAREVVAEENDPEDAPVRRRRADRIRCTRVGRGHMFGAGGGGARRERCERDASRRARRDVREQERRRLRGRARTLARRLARVLRAHPPRARPPGGEQVVRRAPRRDVRRRVVVVVDRPRRRALARAREDEPRIAPAALRAPRRQPKRRGRRSQKARRRGDARERRQRVEQREGDARDPRVERDERRESRDLGRRARRRGEERGDESERGGPDPDGDRAPPEEFVHVAFVPRVVHRARGVGVGAARESRMDGARRATNTLNVAFFRRRACFSLLIGSCDANTLSHATFFIGPPRSI
eukprot:31513-Pelagococcus_subviridis.AAC.2